MTLNSVNSFSHGKLNTINFLGILSLKVSTIQHNTVHNLTREKAKNFQVKQILKFKKLQYINLNSNS